MCLCVLGIAKRLIWLEPGKPAESSRLRSKKWRGPYNGRDFEVDSTLRDGKHWSVLQSGVMI